MALGIVNVVQPAAKKNCITGAPWDIQATGTRVRSRYPRYKTRQAGTASLFRIWEKLWRFRYSAGRGDKDTAAVEPKAFSGYESCGIRRVCLGPTLGD